MRFVSAFLALLLSGCSAASVLNATVPSRGVGVERDVPYAAGPRHVLDIYRPPGEAPGRPLVVFIHGGSWRTGDKSLYPFVALPLAARGAVVVVPNYRLYPDVEFPGFVEDGAQAVAWAAAHAARLGADPHRVFIMGHSAGAHTALMLALDAHYLRDAGYDRDRLAGVIGLAGPYDFLPITGADIKPVFASVDDGPLSQPITFADGRNPPLLLLTGDADTTVNPRNTASLARRLRELGGPVDEGAFPGVGHIGLVTAFAPVFQRRAPVLDRVWTFIAAHGGVSG